MKLRYIFAVGMIANVHISADLTCPPDEFPCGDGSRCLPSAWFCNGYVHCRDGSDEHLRSKSEKYAANSSFCRGKNGYTCVLPSVLYPNKENFCNEDYQCRPDEFPCSDGSGCFNKSWVCDRDLDCRDGSDEVLRDRTITYDPGVHFYPRSDGHFCVIAANLTNLWQAKCTNSSDCQCQDQGSDFLNNECFRCLSRPTFVLPISRLCDGVVDCPDLSDECLCPWKARLKICEKINFSVNKTGGGNTEQYQPQMNCVSATGSRRISIQGIQICDGRKDCLSAKDEVGCYGNGTTVLHSKDNVIDYKCPMENKHATKCDGVPECDWFMDEECDCPRNATFCQYLSRVNSTTAGCGEQTIRGYRTCDGTIHCENSSDERGCDSTRFYCGNSPTPNIPLRRRCDRHDDCLNGADEKNCPHFYCNDNGALKYIHKRFACDGFQDCKSGRDECDCVSSVFSDDKSMIKSKAILAFVWMISSIAVIGCLSVVTVTLRDLLRDKRRERKNISSHTKLIKITILSLSLSDFLVATYTFAICIKAVQFDKDYCKVDRHWRSSNVCSLLGALLVIGSEQSVFAMVLIAAVRLFSVLRPFSHPNIRLTVTFIASTWTISILLGVIPMLPGLEDYFVKSVLFSKNSLFKVIYSNETTYYIKWLRLLRQNHTNPNTYGLTEWDNMASMIAKVNPNFKVAYTFGYYSSHTVCLPTLFPDRSDRAWHYTLLLLIINFMAFVFMLIAYILLYRHATANTALECLNSIEEVRRKQNTRMQRKLTRIVVSDFLCWMPICIMGFLQMSGINIPADAYIPSGLLIIPINSALNPVLYSDIPDILTQKIMRACSDKGKEPPTMEMRTTRDSTLPSNGQST